MHLMMSSPFCFFIQVVTAEDGGAGAGPCGSIAEAKPGGSSEHAAATSAAAVASHPPRQSALGLHAINPGVRGLRGKVADSLTAAHFEALQTAFQYNNRDYSYMRRCKSLDQLKTLQRVSGADAGSRMCVWADWTQIQLVADIENVTLLIKDAAAGIKNKQTFISLATRTRSR